jgi:hypothetical protein
MTASLAVLLLGAFHVLASDAEAVFHLMVIGKLEGSATFYIR